MKTGVWLQNLYEKKKKSLLLWCGLASASEAEPGDSRSSLANKVSSRPEEDPVPKLRRVVPGEHLGLSTAHRTHLHRGVCLSLPGSLLQLWRALVLSLFWCIETPHSIKPSFATMNKDFRECEKQHMQSTQRCPSPLAAAHYQSLIYRVGRKRRP